MAANSTNMDRSTPDQNPVAKDAASASVVTSSFPKFLSLPLELRREIYYYVMEDQFNQSMVFVHILNKWLDHPTKKAGPLKKGYPRWTIFLGGIPYLMHASQQLYIEAGLVFLSNSLVEIQLEEQVAYFPDKFYSFLDLFPGDSGYKAVRHILFWNGNYSLGLNPFEEKNFLHQLPCLTKLEIQLEYRDLYDYDFDNHDNVWEVPVLQLIEEDGGSLEMILGCRALKQFIITEEDAEWTVENSRPVARALVRNDVNAFAGMLRAKFQAQGQVVEVSILFLEEDTRTWTSEVW